jgi:alpha-tubulin suppressor-like RCC1 family protein
MDCGIPQLITALLGQRARAIAAGFFKSCAVTVTGALYTWGSSHCGSLGHEDARDRNVPTLVQGLHNIRVVAVSAHFRHTLVLAADGSVYAFGKGRGMGINQGCEGEGEEGNELTHCPQRIPGLVCMVPYVCD